MDKQVNWYKKDPNEALDVLYNEIEDDGKRFTFFKNLIRDYPELEIDWLETFEDVKNHLLMQESIDDIRYFINWYSKKFPEDYSNRYEFIEGDLCNYYLFKKDYKSLQKRIDFIQQNPVPAIDTLTIRLLFQLIYHGQYQQAVNFSEQVWKPIDESTELIGNAAYDFVNTIYINNLQEYYESVLQNTSFDTDVIFNKAIEMGFSDDRELFNEVLMAVKSDLDIGLIKISIKEKKDNHMLHLNIQFLKYMYQQFNMPFVFSELMWKFIAILKIFGRHGKENWFYIDAKTMDKHIAEKYDNFLKRNKLQIFGQVWGFDYVISFFNHWQLITPDQFQKMTENNTYFKNAMMKIVGGDLWKMMFVFNWLDIENNIKNNIDPVLFESTFGTDEYEAGNNIVDYVSAIPLSERIVRELKLNKKQILRVFYAGDSPYKKEGPDVGRNDPCPCGSGKKYKICCMEI